MLFGENPLVLFSFHPKNIFSPPNHSYRNKCRNSCTHYRNGLGTRIFSRLPPLVSFCLFYVIPCFPRCSSSGFVFSSNCPITPLFLDECINIELPANSWFFQLTTFSRFRRTKSRPNAEFIFYFCTLDF